MLIFVHYLKQNHGLKNIYKNCQTRIDTCITSFLFIIDVALVAAAAVIRCIVYMFAVVYFTHCFVTSVYLYVSLLMFVLDRYASGTYLCGPHVAHCNVSEF